MLQTMDLQIVGHDLATTEAMTTINYMFLVVLGLHHCLGFSLVAVSGLSSES